jgi:hypothetical protein
MKIGFSKYQIAIIINFMLAFVSVMLTYVSTVFVYITLGLLTSGFAMLSVQLILNYKKLVREQEHEKQELLMELSVTQDGEKYVMSNSPYTKAQQRELRAKKIDRLLPAILSVSAAVMFLYFFVMRFFS